MFSSSDAAPASVALRQAFENAACQGEDASMQLPGFENVTVIFAALSFPVTPDRIELVYEEQKWEHFRSLIGRTFFFWHTDWDIAMECMT